MVILQALLSTQNFHSSRIIVTLTELHLGDSYAIGMDFYLLFYFFFVCLFCFHIFLDSRSAPMIFYLVIYFLKMLFRKIINLI